MNKLKNTLNVKDVQQIIFFDNKELIGTKNKVLKLIQKQKEEISKLEKLAFYDELTWLLNRHWLKNEIEKNFVNKEDISVIVIDINNLKLINEANKKWINNWDHAIYSISEIIKNNFRFDINNKNRNNDIICRYWWDEFLIITKKLDINVLKNRIEYIKKEIWDKSKSINKNRKGKKWYPLWASIWYTNNYKINDYKIANSITHLNLKKNK